MRLTSLSLFRKKLKAERDKVHLLACNPIPNSIQYGNWAGKGYSAENPTSIRRAALDLLNNNGSGKDSLRRRKLRACLSDRYCTVLIFGKMPTGCDCHTGLPTILEALFC
jgi:hypothetical protein